MTIYARKVRYRNLDRLRHSNEFLDFLTDQASRLAGTGTGQAVTFTNASNLVNQTAHGYVDGQGPFLLSNSGGALPAELDNTTDYWINVNNANSFTLHTNEVDALAGSNPVAFTDDGTGTHEILVSAESVDIFTALLAGKTADQIRALTSIDNL